MKRIAVIGDAMCDYWRIGISERVSPEAPNCPILTRMGTRIELGGAANVAYWLANQADLEVTLFCHRGLDDTGWDLKKLCRRANIDLSETGLRRHDGYTTTRKERLCRVEETTAKLYQIARCDDDTDCQLWFCEQQEFISGIDKGNYDLVLAVDYQKGVFCGEHAAGLIDWLGSCPAILVNSKHPLQWAELPLTTLICNGSEAQSSWPETSIAQLHQQARAHRTVLTHGAQGVTCNLLEEEDSTQRTIWNLPSFADKVIDVTGAGDAFTAGFAYEYLRRPQLAAHAVLNDSEVKRCITEGQRWAAWCCRQVGCGVPVVAARALRNEEGGNE